MNHGPLIHVGNYGHVHEMEREPTLDSGLRCCLFLASVLFHFLATLQAVKQRRPLPIENNNWCTNINTYKYVNVQKCTIHTCICATTALQHSVSQRQNDVFSIPQGDQTPGTPAQLITISSCRLPRDNGMQSRKQPELLMRMRTNFNRKSCFPW